MAEIVCVGAILYNRQGQILLQLRDDKPDITDPNQWTMLGGKVEAGERPDEAMRRELWEEVELEPELRIWRVCERRIRRFNGGTVLIEQYFYSGLVDRSAETMRLHEGQAVKFFSLEDLENIPIAFDLEPVFREFIEEVL